MSERTTVPDNGGRTTPMDCLTTVRRRRVIQLLTDQEGSTSERALAARLVAEARGTAPDDVSGDVVQDAWLGLRHNDLPKLEEAGLATWDRANATVTPTDHPALSDPQFQALVETADERVAEAMASEQCRWTLTAMAGADGDRSRDDLAAELAANDEDGATSADGFERARLHLHHSILPKLEALDLVECEDETVTYCGPATLPVAEPDEDGFEPAPANEEGKQLKIP